MSPRPRKASDDEIFAAAHRAMQRLAPAQLTLAEIASEAGLTAGALVQRFGSKRALLLALFERHAGATPAMFEALRRRHSSPLAALRGYARATARMAASPAALAHNLSYLQLDFEDEDFHALAQAQALAARAALETLVRDAVAAGELLPHTNVRALARLIQSAVGGSLIAWGFFREGKAETYLVRDLETLLEGWRA